MAARTRDEVLLLRGIAAIQVSLEVFEDGQVVYNIEKATRHLAAAEALLAEIRGEGRSK